MLVIAVDAATIGAKNFERTGGTRVEKEREAERQRERESERKTVVERTGDK